MMVRGVRGAVVAERDEPEMILSATNKLLQAILDQNTAMKSEDLASAIFTASEDLTSVFPARAAREMGWVDLPLMCMREIPVPGSLERCIRVLLHWNTDLPQSAIRHVYLGEAAKLRPDLKIS